uniref:Uncharacterized protein n=1 Tax=Klebsiella pneumoniae TaxID=573 RepID=A0A2P1BNW4_KLEPN|nr:hypothetical protein [Klebsiella pneumoniae]
MQTQFPSDRLFGTRIFPSTGWFERPDMIKPPVKCYCVCLQYTAETLPSTLHARSMRPDGRWRSRILKAGTATAQRAIPSA